MFGLNAGVEFHPPGHFNLFMSEPLVYTNPHIWTAYLIVMVVLVISALYLLYQQKLDRQGIVSQEGRTTSIGVLSENDDLEEVEFMRLKTKQDVLLRRIQALDQDYDGGRLGEEEHQMTREKYKQILVRVKLQLREIV